MKRVIIILFLCSFANLQAQTIMLERANKLYQVYAFGEAADIYKRLHDRSPNDPFLVQQLAYCYEKMDLYPLAISYYSMLIEAGKARNEDYFNYASLLLKNGQFDDATKWFETYQGMVPNDVRPNAQLQRIRDISKLTLLELVDTVVLAGFNTPYSDMAPMFFHDELVFVSARDTSKGSNYSWNNQPFLDIYRYGLNRQGIMASIKMPGVNSKYHEGPVTFSDDFKTIWITRNNPNFSVSRSKQEAVNNLRIFTFEWNGKRWAKEKEFQYNSDSYSVGHPAFNANGNTLYFASDMPGGMGETDLFRSFKIVSEIDSVNKIVTWSEPENLGPLFNTSGKEMFPYVHPKGIVFFASDGLGGFGGLDIFAAFPVADSFNVINLGPPINSTYDDFGLIIDSAFVTGYFSSNRPGGVGSDDIYTFRVGPQNFTIDVKLAEENHSIVDCPVWVRSVSESKEIGRTNEAGRLTFPVDYDKATYYEINHPSYISNNDSLMPYEIFKVHNRTKTVMVSPVPMLQVLVVDEANNDPLTGATVELEFEGSPIESYQTDATGKIVSLLKKTGTVRIKISRDGYVGTESSVVVADLNQGHYSYTAKIGKTRENKPLRYPMLYYGLASSEITPQSALVLTNVAETMKQNPSIVIELGAHTDSRSNELFNLRLSEHRAEAAKQFLVDRGISANRIVVKAYGKSRLLNHCADGVKCSEEEHRINRRTEIRILQE